MAEVVRAGLQAIPKGQYEAAMAVGLSYWQAMRLIMLPQALKITIPNIVNTYIGLFKDTTLVFIVGIFDFLKTIEAARGDVNWAAPTHQHHRICLCGGVLFRVLLRHVALCALRRAPPPGGRPALRDLMDANAPARSRFRPAQLNSTIAVDMVGVHKWYGDFHVLRDINLRVGKGERIVICGPSGPASRP